MLEVIWLQSILHNGKNYKRRSIAKLDARTARTFEARGIVAIVGESANPTEAAGLKPSALQVVPALPEQTLKKSKRGGKKKTAGA